MNNPWESIDLDSYEKHMSLANVYQLQALNEIMKSQFTAYPVHSIMILGIAGGNGMEHINLAQIKKVYGVDINRDYLDTCTKRYNNLAGVFEPIYADLMAEDTVLPKADILIANLLIEYVGYECLEKTIIKVNPMYVSATIQINTNENFVSDSVYIHAFDRLDEVLHDIEEKELTKCMENIGYTKCLAESIDLPNGKKFVRVDFNRNLCEGML